MILYCTSVKNLCNIQQLKSYIHKNSNIKCFYFIKPESLFTVTEYTKNNNSGGKKDRCMY